MLNSLNVDQKQLSNHPDLVNQLAEDVPMSAQLWIQLIVSVDSLEGTCFKISKPNILYIRIDLTSGQF